MTSKWTDDELRASVDAYVDMLRRLASGKAVVKSDEIRALQAGPLKARTKGSIEYRFANISSVLNDLGKEWLAGYVPAANVGPTNAKKIRGMLSERGII